jgi:hypothetical protein
MDLFFLSRARMRTKTRGYPEKNARISKSSRYLKKLSSMAVQRAVKL